ncbi:protein kinase domain-containing protein [Streptomyces sp. TRM49041]|uniref:protein kinase domain-containing protein n=1 Tax=Streptomyces sp. TRM49041 TaxID=2603216 RepID=UPI0021CCEE8E|nr:protein kinase [Streptomyces sp. TRM49041]
MAERLGPPVIEDLLSDRRGSRAWKLEGSRGAVALKANNPEDDGARDKAAEMDQEDRHLLKLIHAGAIRPGYRVDAGAWERGRWLAVGWVNGVPLWRAFALARGTEGDRPSVRPWLLGIARTWAERLARMHAAGWAHADVQPTNTLVTPDGHAAIIDYALSCGPDEDHIPYRGALTHTTAPEVADAILSTSNDTHVQARPPADVWGLGASLFWCWTGQRPVSYEDTADRAVKLQTITKGRTILLDQARPWAFPVFEDMLSACLTPSPEDRPTAADLAAMLTAGTR